MPDNSVCLHPNGDLGVYEDRDWVSTDVSMLHPNQLSSSHEASHEDFLSTLRCPLVPSNFS